MKNLKKVLALVLAFACAFTMFAGAVVYPDVAAGSEFSEAVTMLSDLGIIQGKDDGKYHPEDTITRAEACALIARMLTGDPNVTQYAGASNFTDVVKGSWKESVIGYCVVNGITVGVGNNKFEPDRAITDAEFVTMVVRAMGYETTGTTYPYGHISAAQANGLLDGVSVVPSSAALRGEDAQIMYNALFADYARGAKMINTTHGTSVEEYDTIAHSVFGLDRAAVGTFSKDKDTDEVSLKTCKAHTWVISGKSMEVNGKTNMIEAYPIDDDDTELYAEGNKYPYVFEYEGDISGLKGYQVELWGSDSHNEPEVVKTENGDRVYSYDWEIKAIKTVKGQTAYAYTPADEDLPDVDNDEVVGMVGGTKIDTTIAWGKNTLKEKTVEDALKTKNSASYTMVDWDSDGATDFIVGDIYDYYKVDAVAKKSIKLIGMNGEKFSLDTDGSTDDVTVGSKKYDTVKAEMPSDLEEGDYVQVSTDDVVGKKKITSTWTVEVVEPETKELTKVDTKKGAYFDDELTHDAEEYNKVQYFFDPTDETYDDLKETSVDDWDLYLDANGFIFFLEEADESWAGYIYVTGAHNGDKSTGSKSKLAEISGVNDKNEYLEDVELVKDAEVDGFYDDDEREFAHNPLGRVFHYAVNDDNQITKMEEVAVERGAEDYTYTDKTDAVTVNNYNCWLDDADVIFAVATVGNNGEYRRQYGAETEEEDTTPNAPEGNLTTNLVWDDSNDRLNLGNMKNYAVDEKDLDHKNIIAVTADEIPDINNADSKTEAMGIRYDDDLVKDQDGAVVLGVDTLRYFSHSQVKVGLLTNLTSNRKDDTYTATAYIAGMDGTEFDTIDEDDVDVTAAEELKQFGITKLDILQNLLTRGIKVGQNELKAQYGVYCEFEFNKDGKITAISPMLASANEDPEDEGLAVNAVLENHLSYFATRAVINKVSANDALTVSAAWATGESNSIYTVLNAQYMENFDLTDDTAYYKVTEEKVNLPKNGEKLIPFMDGLKDGYEVEAGSKDDLDSYIRNHSDKYDDEYVVADVLFDDDGDVAAVFYYDKIVKEFGYLNGTLKVNDEAENVDDVTYGEDIVAEITSNDPALDTDSVEISLYKYTMQNGAIAEDKDGNKLSTLVKTLKGNDVVVDARAHTYTATFEGVDVGQYFVSATGINKATEKNVRQSIGTALDVEVIQEARAESVVTMTDAKTPVQKDSYDEGETTLIVAVNGQNDNADLTVADFKVENAGRVIKIDSFEARNDGMYELTLARGLAVDEGSDEGDVVVTLLGTDNYSAVDNSKQAAGDTSVKVVKVEAPVVTYSYDLTASVAAGQTADAGTIEITYDNASGATKTVTADVAANASADDIATAIAGALDGAANITATADGAVVTAVADWDFAPSANVKAANVNVAVATTPAA